ncbi:metallophosphoesterase [Cellulomonas sp. WB94]|uniref:metallophosphoesterase family protein n=1 Tax=Cellulomonas sp. WB94 TaxID=2173174 RepID=UPI000D573F2A|nr:metallophosphoesterase [Cellulomonas sp. WB94]PVU83763.1 metallophosphoesterase [Cellulomonas sp. WB94]
MTAASDVPAGEPAREAPVRRRLPFWLRVLVPAALALAVSLVVGVTTATAELSLGPHEARYDITTDGGITVDVGPLGTLVMSSPLPLALGVRVTVQEIPASVTSVDASSTLQSLSGDLQGYLQFFSGPQATIHDVTRALLASAARRSLTVLALLVGLWFGGRLALGARRRAELAAPLAPHAHQLAAASLVVVLALTVLTSSVGERDRSSTMSAGSPVFDGTALEGSRVTGRLAGVINTYGTYVLNAYRTNQAFYAGADDAFVAAWTDRQGRIDAAATASTPTPTPSPSADEAADPVGKDEQPITLLLVSDLHCNVGMAPLIRSAAKLSGAKVILDAGDTTIDGTAVEQYCVTTFAEAAPAGVPIVTSPGNHDSKETSAMYGRAGATVLSGEVVTVEGIRILGDSDPNSTRIGAGTTLVGKETAREEASRLADVACDDTDGVDLLLIHNPRVGDEALDRGCVPTQLSGHLHTRVGPLRNGSGVRYVSASTAGALLGEPTVGPLRNTAEMTVLRFDPVNRQIIDYQLIQVRTNGSASVGPRIGWPRPLPVSLPSGIR